jgi:micrococcal nuclease
MNKELKKYPVYNPFAILGGAEMECEVLKVYDGDTIWVKTRGLPGENRDVRIKIRLVGINTPEISKKQPGAIEAKIYLSDLILNKKVNCVFINYDNFARVLGTVFYNGLNVNQHMIDKGYAVPYMV